jgi:hypothetical protein
MADREFRAAVWAAADRYRDQGRPLDFGTLLDAAADAGYPPNWQTLGRLADVAPPAVGEFVRPLHVAEFFHHIAGSPQFRTALDPFVVSPAVLAAVVDAGVQQGIGLVESSVTADLGRRSSTGRAEWRIGQPFRLLDELQSCIFDLVVSSPPIGVRAERVALGRGERAVGREMANLLLLRSTRLLSDDGIAVFQVSEEFLWRKDGRQTQQLLTGAGIHLNAVISVAESTSASSIPTILAVFGRQQSPELFVGRISPGMELGELLNNLKARRAGSRIELGGLVERGAFRGWRVYELEHDLARQSQGAPLVRLSEVGTLRAVDVRPEEEFQSAPNSVYVPARGTGVVDAGRPNVEGRRARHFIEVQLDPDRADADFVARWLSSPLGRTAREVVTSGSFIPNLRIEALGNTVIVLPPLPAQEEASGIDRRLSTAVLELNEHRAELWRHPHRAPQIDRMLVRVGQHDQLSGWIERLPFPLASILRAYQTDTVIERKVNRLLGFFEASAEFFAILLLSAISYDPGLFVAARRIVATAGPNRRWPFDQPTFGTWTKIGGSLAELIRTNIAQHPDYSILAACAARKLQLADVLTGVELWDALNSARNIRNQDRHGGFSGSAELERRHERLQAVQLDLRRALGSAFDEVELVRPGTAEYRRGEFSFPYARRLTGSHQIFDHRRLRVFTALDADGIYLVDAESGVSGALAILPFIRLLPSGTSSQQSCYFFHQQEPDGNFIFVSYHREDNSEVPRRDEDLRIALNDLAQST